jgi:hypothetical protein
MTGKVAMPTVKAGQRQLLQYLRPGDWKIAARLPVVATQHMVDQLFDFGWIERRGNGALTEIKLTPTGLSALQAPVKSKSAKMDR